jgi:integrase
MDKKINRFDFRTKTVLKPNAQTNTVCDTDEGQIGSYQWSVQTAQRLGKESKELMRIFVFQFETGCRISEVLGVQHSDILRDGSIKISGRKGSNNRIVNCSRLADDFVQCRKSKINPFGSFNRFFIHRKFVQYGVIFQSKNSKKRSTTHALRQLKAESIRENENSNDLISQTLGQKNTKNANYYGKSAKQK